MALLLSVAALAAIVVFFGLNRPPVLDQTTLCRQGVKLDESDLILVDTTDALTDIQTQQLLAAVNDLRDAIPQYAKLILLFLDAANPYQPTELIALCNPGSPWQANPFVQTERRVKQKWDDSFDRPLTQAVTQLKTAPAAPTSPIMESISAATRRPDFDHRVPHRTIAIVSDMLENVPDYTQYGSADIQATFLKSRLAFEADADLQSVSVVVYYLRRPSAGIAQSQAHRNFWRGWFHSHGATSVVFEGVNDAPG